MSCDSPLNSAGVNSARTDAAQAPLEVLRFFNFTEYKIETKSPRKGEARVRRAPRDITKA